MNFEQALGVSDRLARPDTPGSPAHEAWWPQSLAHGVPGIALLHAELAAAGMRPWQRVHDWLIVATRSPVTTGTSTGLFYGAPALAFALSCVAAVHPGAYQGALTYLGSRVAADARRRVEVARARLAAGQPPTLAEFDAIRGLSGIGAFLLRCDPGGNALRSVLRYLVLLTEPLHREGKALPGWWVQSSPTGRPDPEEFPGGHGNAGLAHGIGGPLALLALAALRGVTVPGQLDSMDVVCAWLDSWRADTGTGPVWPYLIRRSEQETGIPRLRSGAARRPSWCYGTAGLARVQQLAALAIGDSSRRRISENALVRALSDPAQRAATTDASLCHGYAGLAHIAARSAIDAEKPVAARLRELVPGLLKAAEPTAADGVGVLEGVAGTALAALSPTTGLPPATGWDICLLIA